MRKILFVFVLLFSAGVQAQIHFCSWNLCDMGQSKSESAIAFMVQTLKSYDLVALQEIVSSPQGTKAVAKLVAALNRTGAKWDYVVSQPTSGTRQKRERYAFLWQTSRLAIKGKPWLDANFANEIEREPFFGTFYYGKKEFTIVSFHAITKRLQPETEIKYFKFYPDTYKKLRLVFAGDFNCPQSHTVFNPLKKQGFSAVFLNVKTTLRQSCHGLDCLASEFDNIFCRTSDFKVVKSGSIGFHTSFGTLKEARKISDHLPVWMDFEIK